MSHDSSAQWVDPLSDAGIVAALPEAAEAMLRRMRDARYMTRPQLQGRAKYLDVVTLPMANPTPSGDQGSESTTRVIEQQRASHIAAVQRGAHVQRQLTEMERDVVEILDEHGPILTARRIAELLDCDSVEALRDKELHTLQRDGFIRSVARRGYELTELGKASL